MANTTPVFILNEVIILPGQELKIDLTNELSKKIIKTSCKNNDSSVLVIAPRETLNIEPSLTDLPSVGVIASIKSMLELANGALRVVLRGVNRVKIEKYYQNKQTEILKCSTEEIVLPKFDESKETAVRRKLITLVKKYIKENKSASNSILASIDKKKSLDVLTDTITSFLPMSFNRKLSYMEQINPLNRGMNLIDDLTGEINILKIDQELDEKIQDNLETSQREFILKEKLREINLALGNTKEEEINSLVEKLNSLNLDIKTHNKLLSEIKKYEASSEISPESSIIHNYLETVLSLPWNVQSVECDDIKIVENILNDTHYGLEEIKNRIIEYVALNKRRANPKSPIICLVGPPGVGKTSIAISIAKALNREFYKISVGGLNDSTELIGSRRTYLGAAPGKIMQGIIKTKVNNPLILIDEIDKMVKDYKGDPASTMLEILDETQNCLFVDNYIEEPFNLSNVFFILTANDENAIPPILKDRLEIINLNSYSIYEKIDIAKNYLIKNILEDYNCDIKISKDVLYHIVKYYALEPGVRELKRILEKLIRKVLVYEENNSITMTLVKKYLGNKDDKYLPRVRDFGICNTLAYTNLGGQLSHVEVSKVKGTGKLSITGQAGDVLLESVKVVKSYIASNYMFDVENYDIHVHFISGSQKKDGPSAGISITSAMMSCFTNKVVSADVAFTGEITLKGDILPIGNLKEKLIAASTYDIKTVYIPKANNEDLKEVPKNILENLNVKLIENYSEVYDDIFK